MRREFSVLAEGRHIFGRRPKPRAAKPREKLFAFRAGHYKDLTETGNRARKVSGTQGRINQNKLSQQDCTTATYCLHGPRGMRETGRATKTRN